MTNIQGAVSAPGDRAGAAQTSGRPRVAIIGTRGYPSYYGGFETAIRHLAPYLVDHGWDVTVYSREGATEHGTGDPRVRSVFTAGIDSKSLSTLSYGLSSTIHAAVAKPDVALVMNVANGFWLPILRARGVRTVVNVDGIEWERDKWGQAARRLFVTGAHATARWADDLVFDARAIGDRWRRQFGRDGTFIPYGGTTPAAAPQVSVPGSRGYALLVARFVPENTVEEFFDAVPSIAKELDVVIVGSSGYGGYLDDRAQALADTVPGVSWLGHVRDDSKLEALWRGASAYFHGHSVGGTNPALVQAMACGAPIVARDTVYNREVLAGAGTLVDPHPAKISEAITRLGGDEELQRELSASAVRRQQEEYSWERVCGAYERLLRSHVRVPA